MAQQCSPGPEVLRGGGVRESPPPSQTTASPRTRREPMHPAFQFRSVLRGWGESICSRRKGTLSVRSATRRVRRSGRRRRGWRVLTTTARRVVERSEIGETLRVTSSNRPADDLNPSAVVPPSARQTSPCEFLLPMGNEQIRGAADGSPNLLNETREDSVEILRCSRSGASQAEKVADKVATTTTRSWMRRAIPAKVAAAAGSREGTRSQNRYRVYGAIWRPESPRLWASPRLSHSRGSS